MTWKPRPIIGQWTPDQARIAANFPNARRLCVCAANGVGKTYLAADLAVSFMLDHPAARVITTAPTQRQVNELLWPEIWTRLKFLGLVAADAERGAPEWENQDGDRYLGIATNKPARMQGPHAPALLIIIDEASGMTQALLEACEAIAIGDENYIFAIGNPNEPTGPFFSLTRQPSWNQELLSALTHPNILQRREVIPGATNWRTLLARVKDWCRQSETPTGDTFSLDLTEAELTYITTETTEIPRGESGDATTLTHWMPNDAFRVRYLGRFPEQASSSLFSGSVVEASFDRPVPAEGRKFAALDVAREGGDSTIYALRQGNAVTALEVVPPADFLTQADQIMRLIRRDNPENITVECAGLGIGLYDILVARSICPVIEFQPGGSPLSYQDQKRFYNRRAQAYGNLADAMQRGTVSLPRDEDLLQDLTSILYRFTPEQQLQILDKSQIKARIGRSPDRADAISILWEHGTYYLPSSGAAARPRNREEINW